MKKPLLLTTLLLLASTSATLWAEDGEHQNREKHPKQTGRALAQAPAVWKTECGSCHMAYPPGLLPATAWKKQMDTLKNHYGVNATLTAEDEKVIRNYLATAAASGRGATEAPAAGEPPRISRSGWFIRKHDEISPSVWKRKSIGSASNCQACHSGAARGDFDEDGVRIPR